MIVIGRNRFREWLQLEGPLEMIQSKACLRQSQLEQVAQDRVTVQLKLDMSSDGDCITSLDNLLLCCITAAVKAF